jgi:hypothetical protein
VHTPPVSAGTRRACVLLAVAGTLILMAGVLLGVASALLGPAQRGERFPALVISAGLISAGLFCGVLVVVVSMPEGHRGGVADPGRRSHRDG